VNVWAPGRRASLVLWGRLRHELFNPLAEPFGSKKIPNPMLCVMLCQSVAPQFLSSWLLPLIALSALVVTPIEPGAQSSPNNRPDAQNAAFVIRRPYCPTQQKVRSKKPVARTGQWFSFKSPDGDFTLSFPSKPSPEQVGEGPVTDIRTYSLTTVEGTRFSVNFNDIGGDPNSRENNEWAKNSEKEIAAADRKAGFRVVQIHRLEKNLIETELWQPVGDTGVQINYLRRSILRRARVYTLACGSVINGEAVSKPTCQKFFSSLSFTTTKPTAVRRGN
jgi:hypothetical protein